MKNGDKIKCPLCGEKSFVREKKIYDDSFVCTGSKFLCALCGGELPREAGGKAVEKKSAALDRLSQLLGGEEVTKVSIAADADDKRFCCYCAHYIKHPFMNRCGLTLKEIEATDRCENFKKKEAEEQTNL